MIYVDAIRTYSTPLRYKHWCHMATDGNLEELHTMASRLGLHPSWFQDKPGHPHYDLVPSKRALAINYGAQAVESDVLIQRCFRREALT